MFTLAQAALAQTVTLTKEPFRVPQYFDGGIFVMGDIHEISGTADTSGGKLVCSTNRANSSPPA